MDKLTQVLQQKFGYESFREGQREVIEKLLEKRDVVAILPTGMGKSLLYQLPGYLTEGSVLIISPLLSLMQDQVEQLKMMGEKRVIAINSFLSFEEKERAIKHLSAFKYIFTSPEMLQNERFHQALRRISISFIVADEAHCISQWGFDFRPDYLRISKWLREQEHTPVLALTATATAEVLTDIEKTLLMKDVFHYIHSLDRPSIYYESQKVENHQEKVTWIINRVSSTAGPGIIYTQSRKKAELYSEELRQRGIKAAYYHAKMEQDDRILIQQQFQQGELEWICATNAFGMGIHKANIRQVIHDHIPTSIAGYMQEIGRAARDGKQSIASILYHSSDVEQAFYVATQDYPEKEIIHLAFHSNEEIQLPETTERILDYWKEQLSEQETIDLFQSIRQKKWIEIERLYKLLENETCIREQLVEFFGQQLKDKPSLCCSKCGGQLDEMFAGFSSAKTVSVELNWKNRLERLL